MGVTLVTDSKDHWLELCPQVAVIRPVAKGPFRLFFFLRMVWLLFRLLKLLL